MVALSLTQSHCIASSKLPCLKLFLLFPEKIPPAPPGATATPSNQGTVPTCTSHAVGKAVVQRLHERKINCTQGEVIATLINLKQMDFKRLWPTEFNDVSLALQVWERNDDEAKKDWINIKISVFQSDNTEPLGDKAVKRDGWEMVVVYRGHAVFAEEYDDGEFHCINSWGDDPYQGEKQDQNPIVRREEVIRLYYVTISLAPKNH